MSRIFDALQRSVGESSGDDSATLPLSQELLRQAERRAVSDWKSTLSLQEPDLDVAPSSDLSKSISSSAENLVAPAVPDVRTTDDTAEAFEHFKTMHCTITYESRVACLTDQGSPAAEAIRLLAVRLRDIRRSRPLKKVLITSSIPKEGKSTISCNLACVLAQKANEKVLLIEGDVRLPALLQSLGIDKRPGLCELLSHESKPFENIYRVEEAGLWILPAGNCPANPLELLQSPKLQALMDQNSTYFDWIIIDTPPVLPLADTSIWMRLADGVLLVTRKGVSEKQQLQRGLDALEPSKVLGAVLNGSKASAYSDYYYGNSSHS